VNLALALHACAHRQHGPCFRKNTKIVIHTVQEAIVHYRADNTEQCPPSLETLVVERYLARAPRDEWKQPLRFTCPGSHAPDTADVTSAGRDRRFGTADDIRSWDF